MLATSRARLGLRGERDLPVLPLPVPDPDRPVPLPEGADEFLAFLKSHVSAWATRAGVV